MSAPVRLEDIEEFETARRILRSAINDNILDGVHQLNETEVVEPFLRDILPDKSQIAAAHPAASCGACKAPPLA